MHNPTYSLGQLEGFIDAASKRRPADAAQMNDVVEALGLRGTPQRRVTQAELEAAAADLPVLAKIRDLALRTGCVDPDFAFLMMGGCGIAA